VMKKQASRVIGVTLFYLRFWNLTCVDPGCHDVNSRWLHVSKACIRKEEAGIFSFLFVRFPVIIRVQQSVYEYHSDYSSNALSRWIIGICATVYIF